MTITTDNTDYIPFMTYARSGQARQELWRLYRLRGHPKNLEVLSRMLEKRHELATLLGYASWAAYVTEDKMIGSERAAAEFIARIAGASEGRARRDYAQLLERKQKDDPTAKDVDAWDSAFYQERVKAEEYGFDSQAMRAYFEYERVKQGVLDITARMFGVEYRKVADAPVWHAEVEAYDVFDQGAGSGTLVGRIYLDMHPREGKYKHDAQFTLANGAAGRALPEGVLVCNFPRPTEGEPALMEHGDGAHVLPRVRPPAAPRARRPHALGRAVGRGHRVGLRRGAVADARGVDLGPGDAADVRAPLEDGRADAGRAAGARRAPPTSSARGCGCASRCSTRRRAWSSTRAIRAVSTRRS